MNISNSSSSTAATVAAAATARITKSARTSRPRMERTKRASNPRLTTQQEQQICRRGALGRFSSSSNAVAAKVGTALALL